MNNTIEVLKLLEVHSQFVQMSRVTWFR